MKFTIDLLDGEMLDSLVLYQNQHGAPKYLPVIHIIPIGDAPRVMIPPIYLILASITQTLPLGQHVIFPCPKVPFRNRLLQHQKRNWTMVSTPRFQHPDTFPYMHMVKIHQQCLKHLPYWWCGRAGNNRIDIKWPKMRTLQKYLRCYRAHTSVRVIKAVMHHHCKPNNLERSYGAQHYTYGYKVQLLIRAIGRLGRCQGMLSPKKGHLGPKTGFLPLAPTSAWSCP
ncbi:hypothetical protein FRACYDRAFT_257664 [Fragilariopsis cylindrus CCMP1102]|uniref:Uncharacterized protein n=1 Tax=Fragilariopsis cylindrus CCMP1102 TaxID=635003 RepID=A0A1E7EJ31_9STRA|nr:hypothetical protein FRACYDRAFT_257664 [Fragilariopsis cylindrus CCMP1102]|eukprot:OEU05880.1 hypothetical protein FRACYDRAFT_257664 [Fragilariopsis cylindrus CCMP1102]